MASENRVQQSTAGTGEECGSKRAAPCGRGYRRSGSTAAAWSWEAGEVAVERSVGSRKRKGRRGRIGRRWGGGRGRSGSATRGGGRDEWATTRHKDSGGRRKTMLGGEGSGWKGTVGGESLHRKKGGRENAPRAGRRLKLLPVCATSELATAAPAAAAC